MLTADPKAYDSLIDLLADLLVEDLAAESRADLSDPKYGEGRKPRQGRGLLIHSTPEINACESYTVI
jgi:hypothetical protein